MTAISSSRIGRWRLPGAAKFGPTAAPAASSYIETVIVVSVCSFIIYYMTEKAFSGFFYGEDFNTTSLYMAANHNFFKAIFTPLIIFFRPTAYAWIIITQGILPWDPLIHHWRNFIVLLLCIWLLHRIMLRLVDSHAARAVGIALVTLSKVNLMLIGLINCIEVIGTVVFPLSTLLFLIRYFQGGKRSDYVIAIGLFVLCAFSRDSNVLFLGAVIAGFAANAWQVRETEQKIYVRTAIRLLPFLAATLAYAGVRYALLGLPHGGSGSPYAMHFGFLHIVVRLYHFAGIVVNAPLGNSMVAGPGDLATYANASPLIQRIYHVSLVAAALLAFGGLFVWAIRRDLAFVVPLVWAAALLAPVLIIGNWQNYYAFEPIIALSLALAMTLDLTGPNVWLTYAVMPTLLGLIGVNGYISNQNVDAYAWRWVANRNARLNDQIYKKHIGEPIKGLTIVVDTPEAAALYDYIVQPISTNKHVPLLNALMSPTIETYSALPFSTFSLENVLKRPGKQLVYRFNPPNESFTDITGRTIDVVSADADSVLDPAHAALNVIDPKAGSPQSGWISASLPGPHTLTLKLAGNTVLGSIRIVNPSDDRIGALEIRLLSNGSWQQVFDKQHLEDQAVIDARWPDTSANAIEIVVTSSTQKGAPSSSAAIQKIAFPENREVGALAHAP